MMEEAIKLFKDFLSPIKKARKSSLFDKGTTEYFFCELAKKWIRNVRSFFYFGSFFSLKKP